MRLFVFGDVVLKGFCNFTDIVHVAWDLRPIHREAVIDGARDNVEMDVKYRLAGAGTVRLKDIDAFGGDPRSTARDTLPTVVITWPRLSAGASKIFAVWNFGITKVWPGVNGLISINAFVASSS